jgi:hypothetical protein
LRSYFGSITALESENVLLKRELAMTHNQVFRLRQQAEQERSGGPPANAASAPASTTSAAMRGLGRLARSVQNTIGRTSEPSIRATNTEL